MMTSTFSSCHVKWSPTPLPDGCCFVSVGRSPGDESFPSSDSITAASECPASCGRARDLSSSSTIILPDDPGR
ncbi:hypothetical protein M404DRAFT_832237 [Pisolithus tinctorius Marx 270]|uniref:Uncharacterized protein n=1 Tax=Pisolithus tinctorius Marx 270 TaxID=870435 RepID=A0A0C3KNB3_PISTI|nr:hypothetical protein M404DRAFT_832237 [Pisolithus tinctorius Marx 270]